MNRRNFIKSSTASGIIGATFPGSFLQQNNTSDKKSSTVISDTFELNEVTIDVLQQKMAKGVYTSRKITELYLKRIKTIDKGGIKLNAVIEINPDALAIADAMDKERKAGKLRGPLHGIPVLIKDNIDTADKMLTTAGSLSLVGNIATKDAFIIKQLREAGAVLLGKTNLSEWANFRSTRSSSGWSSRGGQTRNPYVTDRSPCGSSSGSGVAVAANLCAVAIGTETDGSVTAPASFNGIVGLKPTVGLLSRSGIIPISKTQDTAGPMARTVKDVAILLSALTGVDMQDVETATRKETVPTDYSQFLDKNGLHGKRIGIDKSSLAGHEKVVTLVKEIIDIIKQHGAEVIETDLLEQTSKKGNDEFQVLLYEFKDGLNDYLMKAKSLVKSLDDVIAFNRKNASVTMSYFQQELLEQSNVKGNLESKEYLDAVKSTKNVAGIIDKIMADNRLDAIAGITIGFAHCIDPILGDYGTGYYFCPPAAMAGYPHITIPAGFINELPVGFSFMAKAFQEPELFRIAYAFEQATKCRKPPKFFKTVS